MMPNKQRATHIPDAFSGCAGCTGCGGTITCGCVIGTDGCKMTQLGCGTCGIG